MLIAAESKTLASQGGFPRPVMLAFARDGHRRLPPAVRASY
jgi:hypothetical protein